MNLLDQPISVSDFIALGNQIFETALPSVMIEGEVSSFKVNQNKWVFFDLKDAESTINCFMSIYGLRTPLEDGMKVIVTASPSLTKWGKFSLTVKAYRPTGEGSLKKSFELLKAKLETEGLFAAERKRALPSLPKHIGVISSTQAAGYADFIKILNERWGGMAVDVAHTLVQGADAADQIIRAIKYFNELEALPEVLVIIRGGGSADDLGAFNDELLVRAVAGSRIPTLTGIGHEVDTSLVDLAADFRASTPSNAAEILVPNRREIYARAHTQVAGLKTIVLQSIERLDRDLKDDLESVRRLMRQGLDAAFERLGILRVAVSQVNPDNVLKRGYALLRGETTVGGKIEVETFERIVEAEVKNVRQK